MFATITPSSIQTWNRHRLQEHSTSHLLHFNDYDIMQENLETTIELLNKTIHSINSSNKVVTPKLAQPIMYKRKGQWRFRYGKLTDGVHANAKINKAWINIMDEVLDKNLNKSTKVEENNDTDTDGESDKRSWMY